MSFCPPLSSSPLFPFKPSENDYRYYINQPSFDTFAKEAYKSRDGYAIRINPSSHQREMFVAGTRHLSDWLANIVEAAWFNKGSVNEIYPLPIQDSDILKAIDDHVKDPFPYRKKYISKLNEIAKQNNIATVYGHSRGGALVAEMDGPFDKVALDGAMILTTVGDSNILNIEARKQAFDWIIGLGGEHNVTKKTSHFHRVWH